MTRHALEIGQTLEALLLRISPCIEQDARPVHLHVMAAGPDFLCLSQRGKKHQV
jgi:hypothetical protein